MAGLAQEGGGRNVSCEGPPEASHQTTCLKLSPALHEHIMALPGHILKPPEEINAGGHCLYHTACTIPAPRFQRDTTL